MARIAVVLPRLSRYGGVEQFAFRLAQALADTRDCQHEVEFVCARIESPPPVGVRAVVVGRIGGFAWLKMLWFLIGAERARRRGGYDLVISLGKTWNQDLLRVGGGSQRTFWKLSERAWPAGLPRWGKRIRRLLSPVNWLTRIVDNRQYRSGCRIICASEAVADWVRQDYPGIPMPEVIYNLPNLRRFRPPLGEERERCRRALLAAGSEGGFTPDSGREGAAEADDFVCIGTATSNFALKGTNVLVRALARLPERFRLYVAGGRSARACQRLAARLGVENRVVFLGRVDDMRTFYQGLDLFALPSFYDACSNAVLEAAACGLPTLSSASNGSSVFLPPDCVLSDPGDDEVLASRLLALSGKPAPPFRLPQGLPAGLDAWVAAVNAMVDARA